MALYTKEHKIGRIYIAGSIVSSLYRGIVKIYEAVRSCFGSGQWHNRKPWINKEKWKNFK